MNYGSDFRTTLQKMVIVKQLERIIKKNKIKLKLSKTNFKKYPTLKMIVKYQKMKILLCLKIINF